MVLVWGLKLDFCRNLTLSFQIFFDVMIYLLREASKMKKSFENFVHILRTNKHYSWCMRTVLVYSFSKFQTSLHFNIIYFGDNFGLMVFFYDTIRTKGLLFIMTRLSELRKIIPISWFCLQIRHICILKWISKLFKKDIFWGVLEVQKKLHREENPSKAKSRWQWQ